MAQRGKRARSPPPVKESLKSLRVAEEEGVSTAPTASPTADVYHLAVINSCTTSEDIRLPTLPTPALLAAFYDECDTAVEGACAVSTAGLVPWKAAYWLSRVAHVPLGRHSALPSALRLRHDCVSRLHARVVYVRTTPMHRRFAKYFPPIIRKEESEAVEQEEAEGDNHSVICVDSNSSSSREASPSPPLPPQASSPSAPQALPYYLLVNYSENPVYVGRDCVQRGRSAVLQEGDVVSFLECAFDDEGGILDEESTAAVPRAPEHSDDAAPEQAEYTALAEPTQELVTASLRQCLPGALQPTPIFTLPLHHRAVRRRLCEVPREVQAYLQWSYAHTHPRSPPLSFGGTAVTPCDAWMVSRNHLVRAPSMADTTPPSAARDRGSELQGLSLSLPRDAATAAALRQWLLTTGDVEEVADAVVSPLSARLSLDRAGLRRVVAQCAREAAQRQSAEDEVAAAVKREHGDSTVTVEKEEEEETDVKRPTTAPLSEDLAESFRVSLSPQRHATPTRASTVLLTVLEELRRSQRRDDDLRSPVAAVPHQGTTAAPPVRRSLRLEEDPIELFTDDGADEDAGAEARGSVDTRRSGSLEHVGHVASRVRRETTAVPGVRLSTAQLPVYVFTRRSRSPDVYTREGASLASPTAKDKALGAAVAAAQYVYYFQSDDETREGQHREGDAGFNSAAGRAVVVSSSVGTAARLLNAQSAKEAAECAAGVVGDGGVDGFAWIDEAELHSAAKKKARRRRKF